MDESVLAQGWFEAAAGRGRHIVLPEGADVRVLTAARQAVDMGLCRVSVLGEHGVVGAVVSVANEHGISLSNIEIINPETQDLFGALAADYSALRERETGKPLPMALAAGMVRNPLIFAAMMLNRGACDGVVAGATNTTAAVLRAGRLTVGTAQGIADVSSCFVMECPDNSLGHNGVFGFADCAVIPDPTAEQLAGIAVATVKTMRELVPGFEARIAMLSFSTHGSAPHASVDRIREAMVQIRAMLPTVVVDGELQVDAALSAAVALSKAPQSVIRGDANILIFPDLNSGNIAYKLVQYTAVALAHGPILQGLRRPMNDISRGCTTDDILRMIAITCLQNS